MIIESDISQLSSKISWLVLVTKVPELFKTTLQRPQRAQTLPYPTVPYKGTMTFATLYNSNAQCIL